MDGQGPGKRRRSPKFVIPLIKMHAMMQKASPESLRV